MSTKVINVAMIGLDSSHTIEFARRMQDPEYTTMERVSGLRTVSCCRFPSPFQSEPDQDKRQATLEGWGAKVTRDLEETVAAADVIFMPINDPALHLEWFERCVKFGKPIFLDKPMASSIAHGRRIAALAAENNVPFFSTSSLRYDNDVCNAIETTPAIESAYVFGPLGVAPAGSSVVWYGVHAFEILVAALGTGASTVRAARDPSGLMLSVTYPDDRRGIVELTIGKYRYGGVLRNRSELVSAFNVTGGAKFYDNTLRKVEEFFRSGVTPVPVVQTLEVMGLLDAADRAAASGNVEPVYT